MEHFYQELEGYASEEDQGELLLTTLANIPQDGRLRIAEIGVYKGRGTAMWNVILINKGLSYDYHAIDHFLGSQEHAKGVDYHAATVQNLLPILDRVQVIRNDSTSESKNHPDGHFDMVYIDASHEHEDVMEDILNWLPKVKAGGVICGDDYIAGWPGVVKAVDEVLGDEVKTVGQQQWWHQTQRA